MADTAALAPELSPCEVEQIGKYEIRGLLGRGGMGAVYRAFDPVLQREVALKMMLPEIARDEERKRQFEREARAIACLTHVNVVTVFDLGYHTDGAPYIVMELLRGQDLQCRMKQEPPLSLVQKVDIVTQILEGLGHVHKLGIVHRDIKPANVAITEDSTAKIMDFGIACVDAASAVRDGRVMGSIAYMSPEQARGHVVDGRSDLFSVAAMLCELVTGRRPFQGESTRERLRALLHEEPVIELPARGEQDGLLPVLKKALAKDREERYSTTAEFARALAGCVQPPAPAREPGMDEHPGTGGTITSPQPVFDSADPTVTERVPAEPAIQTSTVPADPSRFFRLLREVYVGAKSGRLHFVSARGCRSLRIFEGQILHANSDVDGEHLGDVLVRYGFIPESVRVQAVATVLEERRALGEVLVSQGLLGRERLEEALGLHVREVLFSMLEGPEGSHSFEELPEASPDGAVLCQLSTGEAILEATRRVQKPALVRLVLGDTDRLLALSRDPLLRSQRITLTPTDGFIMSRVDGTLSAREVISLSPVPAEDAERSLFGLLCTGIIDYDEREVRPRTRPSLARGDARRPRALAPEPTPASPTSASSGPERAPDNAHNGGTQDLRQMILDAHAGLHGDHFEVLRLTRSATEKEVGAAYRRFARVLHPDVRLDPALAELEEERRAVFIRVTRAYETLRNPDARQAYEIAYEPSRLRRPTPPDPTPPPEREPEPAVTEEPAPAPPPEEPDPPDPSALVAEAEVFFAKQAYWDVIQHVEPVLHRLEGPLRTRAVLVLARAYMKNPNWQKKAEGLLVDQLKRDPDCAPAGCFLGQLYASNGLDSRARRVFESVLEIEPGHRGAELAIQALEGKDEETKKNAPSVPGRRLNDWFKALRRPRDTDSSASPDERGDIDRP